MIHIALGTVIMQHEYHCCGVEDVARGQTDRVKSQCGVVGGEYKLQGSAGRQVGR